MKKSFRIFTLVFLLFMVGLACVIPGGVSTSDPADALNTRVVASLTAFQQSLPNGARATPTVLPEIEHEDYRMAYLKDNDVWFCCTFGTLKYRLTFTGDVQDIAISPDGQIVAYIREIEPFNHEIWAVHSFDPGNSKPFLLVSSADFMAAYSASETDKPAGLSVFQFDWQPGTHNLFYNTRPLFEGPGSFGYDDLQKVDVDSLTKSTVFSAGNGGKFYFSPDGNHMAIVRPASISTVNSDGSNLRENVVVYPEIFTYSEYLYYPTPIWAPDSSYLRVVIPPADPMLESVPYTLWFIPTDGSPAIVTGTISAIPFDWPDKAISPDLNRLGYVQKTEGEEDPNLRDIKLANADGSGEGTYLTGEGAQFLGWLPNSAQFVFKVSSGPDIGVHVSSLEGGYITLSLVPSEISSISWTDPTHGLVLMQKSDVSELLYVHLGGSNPFFMDSGQITKFDFTVFTQEY